MTWLSRAIALIAFAGVGLVGLARLTLWIRWRLVGHRRARVCVRCGKTIETGAEPSIRSLCPICQGFGPA
jgi:hypothetical protein